MENPYIKYATIKDKKVKCLIDTGSTSSLIRESVLEKIGLRYHPNSNRLRSFDGNLVSALGSVRTLARVDEASATVALIVMRDDKLTQDCIIDGDFLNAPNVLLIKSGNKLVLRQLQLLPEHEITNICVVAEVGMQPVIGDVDLNIKEQCRDLLNKYRDCISYYIVDLGKTNTVELTIRRITEEPVVYRPYRMPVKERYFTWYHL